MPGLKLNTPIKERCDELGHTLTWFARQLGISRTQLAHIEDGTRKPPPLYYERASALLGMPVDKLRPQPPHDEEG